MGFITPVIYLNSRILLKSVLLMPHFLFSILNLFCSYLYCLFDFPLLASLYCFCFFSVSKLLLNHFIPKCFLYFFSYFLQIFIGIQEKMQQNKLFLYKLFFLLLTWMRNVYKMCYAVLRSIGWKCLGGSNKKYFCGNQAE